MNVFMVSTSAEGIDVILRSPYFTAIMLVKVLMIALNNFKLAKCIGL